ncbi:MAG: 3'-5' exonuclease [Firmicutes bacterium]|nr:3'-5' exonuclease [Bacillota bacterium]
MNFTAIDFETATSSFTSVCSLGICVVENNKIIERKELFIRPEPLEFNEYNIKIHGIPPAMVEDKPTFDEYWGEIRPYIEGKTVIAHNASFDIRVLCSMLDMYGIPYPAFEYLCTVKLSQKAYPELPSHKLNKLCSALGIRFHHHDACDDAYACAMAMLRIADDYSLTSVKNAAEHFEMEIGSVYPGYHFPCKKNKKKEKSETKKKSQRTASARVTRGAAVRAK